MHGDGLAVFRGIDRSRGGLGNAVALECGDLHDLAAELTGQLLDVYNVAVLAHDIHHVDRDDNGDAKLGELSGQIKVTLGVGAVDDVEYCIGALAEQEVTRDDLLKCVRGKRIDARKVNDRYAVKLLELAFLLLNGDAGPVAYKLVRAGQRVEQCGLTTVRVARKGNFNVLFHYSTSIFSASALRRESS